MEGMLATRPDFGLGLLDALKQPIQAACSERPPLAALHGNVPVTVRSKALGALVRALVTRVAKDSLFITVKKAMRLGDVGHIGRHALERVHETGVGIVAHIRLHAEVVLVTFFV